jgi:ribosome-interacting GTPase 1
MNAEQARERLKQQAAELRREIEAKEQRRRESEAMPPAYLSHSAGRWRVIVQGMPICSDKATAAEATAATTAHSVKLAPVYWDGDRAQWIPMQEAAA